MLNKSIIIGLIMLIIFPYLFPLDAFSESTISTSIDNQDIVEYQVLEESKLYSKTSTDFSEIKEVGTVKKDILISGDKLNEEWVEILSQDDQSLIIHTDAVLETGDIRELDEESEYETLHITIPAEKELILYSDMEKVENSIHINNIQLLEFNLIEELENSFKIGFGYNSIYYVGKQEFNLMTDSINLQENDSSDKELDNNEEIQDPEQQEQNLEEPINDEESQDNETEIDTENNVVSGDTGDNNSPEEKINEGELEEQVLDKKDELEEQIDNENTEMNNEIDRETNSDSDHTGDYLQKDSTGFNATDKYFEVVRENVPVYINSNGSLIEVGSMGIGESFPRIRDYGNWHEIQYGDKRAYVWKESTTLSSGKQIKNENTLFTSDGIRLGVIQPTIVYDNSSGDLKEIGRVKEDQSIQSIGSYGNWYRIDFGGRIGFIHQTGVQASFSSNDKYFETTLDNVPVYVNQSGQLKEIGSMRQKESFVRIRDYGNWHEIQYGDQRAYVWKKSTKPSSVNQVQSVNTKFNSEGNVLRVINSSIVYDNSRRELKEIGRIKEGQTIRSIGSYGNWYRIDFGGRIGFIHQNGVQVSFNSSDKYFQVTKENAPVYNNQNGQLKEIGTMRLGESFVRIRDYGNWHEIQYGDQKAYVWKESTKPSSNMQIKNENTQFQSTGITLRVNNPTSVYDNSGGKLKEIGLIIPNQSIRSIGSYGNWYRIDFGGRVGFIHQSGITENFKQEDKYFEVTSSNVPVYINENGSLKTIGQVEQGETFPRIRSYGKWHEISYGQRTAYVWQASTKPSQANKIQNENQRYESNGSALRITTRSAVYDNTGNTLEKFAEINKGQAIKAIGTYGSSWYRIDFGGRVGYIHQNSVSFDFEANDNNFKISSNRTPIYINSNDNLIEVGYLNQGETFKRVRNYGKWHEIQFGDKKGYILKEATDVCQSCSNTEYKESKSFKKLMKTNIDLDIYDNSGGALKSFGILKKGSEIRINRSYGNNWYEVNVGGRIGYIYSDSTQLVFEEEHIKDKTFLKNYMSETDITSSFRLTNLKGDLALYYGDLILDNQIYVLSIWEPYKYKTLDWNMNPYQDNSWQLYFHSLRMLDYLLNAYEVNGETKYLDKAIELAIDWIDNNTQDDPSTRWAWADHAVSSRILTISYLLDVIQKSNYDDYDKVSKIYQSLHEHAVWQFNNENYRYPHNHGIMQDRSLIQASWMFKGFTESDEWYDLSISRLGKQLESSISSEGVHLEHSPYYHIHTFKLFSEIEELLNERGGTLGGELEEKLTKMKQYLAYVYKPDGTLPLVGDTVLTTVDSISSFNGEYIDFIESKGLEGTPPGKSSVVFEEAGVGILRDKWGYGSNFDKSTYLFLQAGYHSNTHKHADDLAFVLFGGGHDIFVGPGKYTYNNSDMRKHLMSALSHNTVTVNQKSYNLDMKNTGTFIKDYEFTDSYDRIKAVHNLYDGVTFNREITFLKPNVIILRDSLASNSVNQYEQRFNLNPNSELIEIDKDKVKFQVGGDLEVTMRQFNQIDSLNHYYGSKDPIRGLVSYKTNELTKVNQLEFIKEGKNEEFITVIEMESDSFEQKVENLEIVRKDNKLEVIYEMEGKEFSMALN
ncbi:heparinase II/III family protein [Salipaludibacillus sp. CF4.18]|uniref:heparinase II/III family protein n=1 Tax=Salipaludibacillus sp. CF4.18 TaxID=3373081 RepID=UPI003EE73B2B